MLNLVTHSWNALCSISFVDWIDEGARDLLDVKTHRLGTTIHGYSRILSEGGYKGELVEKEIFHQAPLLGYFISPRLQAIHKSLDSVTTKKEPTLFETAEGCGLGYFVPITKVAMREEDGPFISKDRLGIVGLCKAGFSEGFIGRITANLKPFLLKLAKLIALIALPVILFLAPIPMKATLLWWVGYEMAIAVARFAIPLIQSHYSLPAPQSL